MSVQATRFSNNVTVIYEPTNKTITFNIPNSDRATLLKTKAQIMNSFYDAYAKFQGETVYKIPHMTMTNDALKHTDQCPRVITYTLETNANPESENSVLTLFYNTLIRSLGSDHSASSPEEQEPKPCCSIL